MWDTPVDPDQTHHRYDHFDGLQPMASLCYVERLAHKGGDLGFAIGYQHRSFHTTYSYYGGHSYDGHGELNVRADVLSFSVCPVIHLDSAGVVGLVVGVQVDIRSFAYGSGWESGTRVTTGPNGNFIVNSYDHRPIAVEGSNAGGGIWLLGGLRVAPRHGWAERLVFDLSGRWEPFGPDGKGTHCWQAGLTVGYVLHCHGATFSELLDRLRPADDG